MERTLTRKDYRLLAGALYTVRPSPKKWAQRNEQWKDVVRVIADVLARENPRFNRHKFYRMCVTGKES